MKPDRFRADDPRLDDLDRLLEQRAVPFGGYGMEQLDGYLTAVVLAPGEPVPEDEWMPRVWGGKPPRWENAEDEAAAVALLRAALGTAARRVRVPGDDYVLDDALLWWLPDDPEADHGDDVDIGAAWAGGFLDGMALRDDAWDAWTGSARWRTTSRRSRSAAIRRKPRAGRRCR